MPIKCKMELNKIGFLINEGLYYPEVLKEVGKSNVPMQPLFEAFTNSLEAIAQLKSNPDKEKITVKVYYDSGLFDQKILRTIVVEDTGIGFNDEEFKRFLTFKDTRKGYHNRGSGRIQLIHSFLTVRYNSVYEEGEQLKQRQFHLSKASPFLKENAIAFLDAYSNSKENYRHTTLTLSGLIEKKDEAAYHMPLQAYKEAIISRYIQYFCAHRESLPQIILEAYNGDALEEILQITSDDIPAVDSTDTFKLNYYDSQDPYLARQEKQEIFTIQAFKIPKAKLIKNAMTLTSKGEIVQEKDFKLELHTLAADDHLDNKRFLFLISSDYINNRDSDTRGQLRIPRRKAEASLFDEQVIFLDDIEYAANDTIVNMYSELADKAAEKAQRVSDLKEMFLLGDDYLSKLNISINDTEEKILEKVYIQESKKAAKKDAELKKRFDSLNSLNPTSKDYDSELNNLVSGLVKEILIKIAPL